MIKEKFKNIVEGAFEQNLDLSDFYLEDLSEPTKEDIIGFNKEFSNESEEDVYKELNTNITNHLYNKGTLDLRKYIIKWDFNIALLNDIIRELEPVEVYVNMFKVESFLREVFIEHYKVQGL